MRRLWQPGSLEPLSEERLPLPREQTPDDPAQTSRDALITPTYDYIVLTAAITRPDLHTHIFPGHLRLVGSARVKWLINVDAVRTGHSVEATIANLARLITAPNIDLEFLPADGPGCFFQAARRLAMRAGELLAQCRTGVVWLEDDWRLATRNHGQQAMSWLRYHVARNPDGAPLRRCLGDLGAKQATLDAETMQRNALWFVSLVPRNLVSFNPGIWSKALFTRALLQTLSSRGADAVDDPETLCADPMNRGATYRQLSLFIDPAYQDAGRQWSAERGLAKWDKAPDELSRRGSVTYADTDASRLCVRSEALDKLTGWVTMRRAFGTPLSLLGRIAMQDGRLCGGLVGFSHVTFDLHPLEDGTADIYLHRIHRWSRTYPYKKIKGRVSWRAEGGQLEMETRRRRVVGSLSRSMPMQGCWIVPLQAAVGAVYFVSTLITRLLLFDGNPKRP